MILSVATAIIKLEFVEDGSYSGGSYGETKEERTVASELLSLAGLQPPVYVYNLKQKPGISVMYAYNGGEFFYSALDTQEAVDSPELGPTTKITVTLAVQLIYIMCIIIIL